MASAVEKNTMSGDNPVSDEEFKETLKLIEDAQKPNMTVKEVTDYYDRIYEHYDKVGRRGGVISILVVIYALSLFCICLSHNVLSL